MRVHLPALIALVSASTYVACGSSDPSKTEEAGGVGGAAGEAGITTGGKSSGAGTQSGGGSKNNAGEAGMTTGGVAANAGAAGSEAGGAGAAGESAGGMSSGAAGAPPDDMSLPAVCPGLLDDYTLLSGSAGDDHFLAADVSGKKLIFGLGGADIFDTEHGGDDCLVGGPGDDDFTNSDEFANYYVGGAGADTYHISTTGNYLRIGDLEAADELSFEQATFTYLLGAAGDNVNANQLHSVSGYSTGTSSGVVEGSSLVYDPSTGELWQDFDGGVKGSSVSDKLILTVLNHDSYTFDPDDFVIE
jgi:hypothetical protein